MLGSACESTILRVRKEQCKDVDIKQIIKSASSENREYIAKNGYFSSSKTLKRNDRSKNLKAKEKIMRNCVVYSLTEKKSSERDCVIYPFIIFFFQSLYWNKFINIVLRY